MSKIIRAGALALAAVASAAAGFRLGTGQWPTLSILMGAHDHMQAPMAQGPEPPAKDMSLAPATGKTDARKVRYYRNPMGLADSSPEPKKDSMGMDYIPVYDDEDAADSSSVKVSLDRVQRSGVRSEPAGMRVVSRSIRAPGIAKPDERTLKSVTLRFDGYIEKLYANTTGAHVKAGEPLFAVYSPEILSAQIDYKRTIGSAAARSREEAAQYAKNIAQRFRNLDLPDSVIRELHESGSLPQRIEWPSPASGILLEKNVVEGQMVKTGQEIFRIADLDNIWVIADVAEQDIAAVKIGAPAKVTFRAFPDAPVEGLVTFVLHELETTTRTAKVRIEVKNPEHRIRHEMYADVEIGAASGEPERLVVPVSALIDSGARQVVIVDLGEGRFEPRAVKPGLRAEGMIEIREGLQAGEKVVVSANFLIDAESNIKAALQAFTAEPKL